MKKALVFLLTVLSLLCALLPEVFAEEPPKDEPDSNKTEVTEPDSAFSDESEDGGEPVFEFSSKRIPTSLKHMGIGMAGVFTVLGIIAVVVYLLNKTFRT